MEAHYGPAPTNTQALHTLDCLYLRYADSHQGKHELLHLQMNKVIMRRKLTPIPVTPHVIRQVHLIAEREDMPDGLKIENRTGIILYDSSWTAGVDYDPEAEDDNVDDDYETDNETEESDEDDKEMYDTMDPDEIQAL